MPADVRMSCLLYPLGNSTIVHREAELTYSSREQLVDARSELTKAVIQAINNRLQTRRRLH